MKVDRHPLLSALAIFLNSRRNDFYFFSCLLKPPPPHPLFFTTSGGEKKDGMSWLVGFAPPRLGQRGNVVYWGLQPFPNQLTSFCRLVGLIFNLTTVYERFYASSPNVAAHAFSHIK